jgi:hypothetical protein
MSSDAFIRCSNCKMESSRQDLTYVVDLKHPPIPHVSCLHYYHKGLVLTYHFSANAGPTNAPKAWKTTQAHLFTSTEVKH